MANWRVSKSHARSAKKNKPREKRDKLSNIKKPKNIAIIAIYAALYAALVVGLGGISYGPGQVRIADSMIAAVPLLGIAGVLGHTLGVFVANIFSPAGPLDLLNTIPSFVMSFGVYYVYKKTQNDYTVIGTCMAYSAVLGITVGLMLSYVFGAPMLPTMLYVAIGNTIASVLIGWPVFKLLEKSAIFQRLLPNPSKN